MADTNPNQKNDKPGLSWTQPANNAGKNNQPNTAQKPASNSASTAQVQDSTARVIGIIIGIVVVFALAAWGIVALHNRSTSGTTAGSQTATSTNATSSTQSASEAGASGTVETGSQTPPGIAETGVSQENNGSAAGGVPTGSMINSATVASGASASFSVASPQDAGDTVQVSNMDLTQPTWIIVYEPDAQGNPNRILGAALFFKGDTSGTVELLRGTTAGKSYLASAAIDNGDKVFSLQDDHVVPDQSGSQMWIKFQTK